MSGVSVSDVVLDWRFEPAPALLLAAAAAAYAAGVVRLARRGRRWPVGQTLCWALSLLAGVLATQSGVGRYDTTRLSVHMVQHLLLGMVVPFTAVCGAPLTLALQTAGPATRRALRRMLRSRGARVLTHPVVTWLLFGGGLVVVYLTPLLALSARDPAVHTLVHVHLVVAGSLFFAGLVGSDPSPRPMPFGARLLSILTAVPFHAFLGLAILSATRPLAPRAYPSLSDQRAAAGLLWGMGELLTLAVAAVVLRRWYVADRREAARADRVADAEAAARPS